MPPAQNVQPTDIVRVNATITDAPSGVLNATLLWKTQDDQWNAVVMNRTTDEIFEGNIPPLEISTTIFFKIETFDKAENGAVADNADQFHTYHVIPEYSAATLLACLPIVMMTMILVVKPRSRKQ